MRPHCWSVIPLDLFSDGELFGRNDGVVFDIVEVAETTNACGENSRYTVNANGRCGNSRGHVGGYLAEIACTSEAAPDSLGGGGGNHFVDYEMFGV